MHTDTALITDRDRIAEAIAAALARLDDTRAAYNQALDDNTVARTAVTRAADAYAYAIAQALATGWFTADGLAAQGHSCPKKLPKVESSPAAPEIDRSQIPELITNTLTQLDESKVALQNADEHLRQIEQVAADVAACYGEQITAALATGWCTVAGLAGQGHREPKKTRGSRRRASETEAAGDLNNPAA